MLNPDIVGARHFHVAQQVRSTLAEYEELKDIISMLGIEELSHKDRDTVNQARRLERFLTQPFFTTGQFTARKGRLVPLDETIKGCEAILAGEYSDISEQRFYMIGSIDEIQTDDSQ